jgi:hypothetical protein
MTVRLETVPPGGGGSGGSHQPPYQALVVRPARTAVGRTSFVLRYEGGNTFRRIMGPEPFLPPSWPGCRCGVRCVLFGGRSD